MTRVFAAYGQPIAIEPRAFGMVLVQPPAPPKAKMLDGGIALIEVHGPLMHHADPMADSYDAIKDRVVGALDEGAKTVVLSMDSPGGLVSGCFDTAEEIRAMCDARGAELIGYVDGCSASAAYALVCAASRVFVPPSGIVGSIGVLDAVIDESVRDRAMGIMYTLIASGARKADGNAHAPTSDAAVAAVQARVDSLATVFFDHVARHRTGLSVAQVASLEAAVFVGADAVSKGLADAVATLDQVLALVREGNAISSAAATASSNEVPMNEEEKARAALKAILDDDKSDEKAKARAKAALAAFDDSSDEEKPKDDEAKAEGDEEKTDEKPKDDEAKAATPASGPSASASLEARIDRVERSQIMGTRPDLSADQRKALAAVPVTALASALAAIPRSVVKPAATAAVAATRGEGQGTGGAHVPTLEPHADLDRAFGTAHATAPIRKDPLNPLRTHYGVLTREQAKAITDKHGGAQ